MNCVLLSDNLLGHWGGCWAKVNMTQLPAPIKSNSPNSGEEHGHALWKFNEI